MKGIVNEEKASSNSKKYKRKSIKVVFITLIIIFFAVLLGFMSSEESGPVNYKEYKYKNITVSLPSYFELDDESEYYNYFTAEARNDVGVEASMLEVYDIVFTKEEIMNGLKDDYDVLEMNEYTLCGLEGYLIKCKYKEYSLLVSLVTTPYFEYKSSRLLNLILLYIFELLYSSSNLSTL